MFKGPDSRSGCRTKQTTYRFSRNFELTIANIGEFSTPSCKSTLANLSPICNPLACSIMDRSIDKNIKDN